MVSLKFVLLWLLIKNLNRCSTNLQNKPFFLSFLQLRFPPLVYFLSCNFQNSTLIFYYITHWYFFLTLESWLQDSSTYFIFPTPSNVNFYRHSRLWDVLLNWFYMIWECMWLSVFEELLGYFIYDSNTGKMSTSMTPFLFDVDRHVNYFTSFRPKSQVYRLVTMVVWYIILNIGSSPLFWTLWTYVSIYIFDEI